MTGKKNDTRSDNSSLLEELNALIEPCLKLIQAANSEDELDAVRVEYLGRKGALARLMSNLPALDPDNRRLAGQKANEIKDLLQLKHKERLKDLKSAKEEAQTAWFDPTLPGRIPPVGSHHPLTLVMDEICRTFVELGYDIVSGPEIEIDLYNFESLNFPPDHPARDMQDTLFISDLVCLRTHTSPLQIRTMLAKTPPLAAIAPGKVYRRDSDNTHSPMFHQIEGFLVGKDINMSHLRGSLTQFARSIFSSDAKVRFRPSFFPFTEPSAEVDISCVICSGKGHLGENICRVCKGTGWIEILGCGMIDPNVFISVGYDPEKYSGFAFGLGVERVAMLKYGIPDLRLFFENDVRFLTQFS